MILIFETFITESRVLKKIYVLIVCILHVACKWSFSWRVVVFSCFHQDTLRDCAQDTNTCYNTVVSPIYFVSFVLTAQFVLVNVVIAVLMKHLEESNKEAKMGAEPEADLELELQMDGGDISMRSPQLNPLALGMDRSSSGGSPWKSTGGGDREQERDAPMDSPTADITRDSPNIRADPPSGLDPPLEV